MHMLKLHCEPSRPMGIASVRNAVVLDKASGIVRLRSTRSCFGESVVDLGLKSRIAGVGS